MIQWVIIISYFFTNELRLFVGLCLIAKLMIFSPERKVLLLVALGGGLSTFVQVTSVPVIGTQVVELLLITTVAWYYLRKKINFCLFLSFFYEVAIGLWDFLLQAGLGILFHSDNFVNSHALESLLGVWLSRFLMLGILIIYLKKQKPTGIMRLISVLAMLGLLGALILSQQTILPLSEKQTGEWIILSMIWLSSILFYRLNQQREVERDIAKLKQEHTEILERDYLALRRTYSDNAKLYHDLHNHIELIYQCLIQGEIEEAMRYCEDLRTPVREISQTVWTGDKAIDYLINSKMAVAEQEQIKTKVNIEYPHNTNIRNVDLTTILGNLLDNALEAVETAPEHLRFINFTIRRINFMLIIKVENGYGKTPIQVKGTLCTSKAEGDFHGWGLKSVQTAANRYDGIMNVEYKDGIFISVVTLSFQPIKND